MRERQEQERERLWPALDHECEHERDYDCDDKYGCVAQAL